MSKKRKGNPEDPNNSDDRQRWLLPKRNSHPRIGEQYQASIPSLSIPSISMSIPVPKNKQQNRADEKKTILTEVNLKKIVSIETYMDQALALKLKGHGKDGLPFILRYWQSGDELTLVKHANNRRIADNLRNIFPFPYTQNDAQWWINHNISSPKRQNLAIVINNEACGSMGIIPGTDIECRTAEIGYWLSEVYWNRGILSNALPLFQLWVQSEYPDIHRIYATVFATNLPSIRVLQKAGFEMEGPRLRDIYFKNNQFHDGVLFAKNFNTIVIIFIIVIFIFFIFIIIIIIFNNNNNNNNNNIF